MGTNMNLTNFLKQTDALTAKYSTEQLIAFVHDIGRVFPEHCREDFLERLRAVGEKTRTAFNKNAVEDTEFGEIYSHIRNNLKSIDSQEVTITGILNEEYDDWYDDGNEEFYYEDNDGISDILAEACDFVHTCMDMEKYQEGFEIGKQLLSMEILCDNEYGNEEFSFEDMVYHELLCCDLKQVILDTAYCTYHAALPAKRPEALFGVIADAGKEKISLEAIMQHGYEELPNFEDFLTHWVTYLGGRTEDDADRLIVEAVALLNDTSLAVRYAERFAAIHPRLYLNILENRKYSAANDMVSIGINALKAIPKNYIIRSRAALETAEYVIEIDGEKSLLEQCYFAAYKSDTSVLNYLRALLNGYECEEKREELQKVFMKFSGNKDGSGFLMRDFEAPYLYPYFERKENKPDRNTVLLLRFLDGQFADVLDEGLNNSKALGWTGTFMKPGIAIYLLCMHEGSWSGKGITAMAGMVKDAMRFSAEEYRKGTRGFEGLSENTLFCQLFSKWKSIVQMASDVREHAIKKITVLLEKRTEGIIDANRRNYYEECAAYIAALGEVRESMGEAGAKQRLMTAYKDKYPRRSAFREEMRNYGWIDIKKK